MKLFRSPADYAVFFVLALVLFWVHLALAPYAFDDAYIHFRIAQQFLETGRPYYNVGEPVMGSSSPAWTLLLTALFAVLPDEAWVVALINAVLTTMGAVVFCALVRRLAGQVPNWICWLFALPYVSLVQFSSIGLMETPLALLLLGLALLLAVDDRPSSFVLLTVASFVRLELAVFWLALAAYAALSRRMPLARALVYALAAALPFIVYWLAFFPPIPDTIRAKSIVYDVARTDVAGYVARGSLPWFSEPEDQPRLRNDRLSLFLLLSPILLALIAAVRRRIHRASVTYQSGPILVCLTGGLLLCAAYVSAGGLVFPWYVPLTAVPLAFAAYAITLDSGSRWIQALMLALFVVPHGLAIGNTVLASVGKPERYRYFQENARVRKYLEVGHDLNARYPKAVLMTSEVGALGFTFRGRVVDGMGLISPEALRHHPMEGRDRSRNDLGAIPVPLVAEVSPELIVGLDDFVGAFLRSPLVADYLRIREPIYVEEDLARAQSWMIWDSRYLNIFIRKDLVGPTRAGRKNRRTLREDAILGAAVAEAGVPVTIKRGSW